MEMVYDGFFGADRQGGRAANRIPNLKELPRASKLIWMPEMTDTNIGTSVEVEQLAQGDFFYQILCGVGIASGLALLWIMESVRNVIFRGLNLLRVPPRRRRRGTAFPAGRPRSRVKEA